MNATNCESWDQLDGGLKLLFARNDFAMHDIGESQRLDYVEMECILYHLMLIIDPKGTKRVFRCIFPARNQDDRSKFINNMVILINKHLPQDKITAPRLRMCGGAPFRNLLASVIRKASEIDMINRMKRFNLPKPSELDSDLSRDRVLREKQSMEKSMVELEQIGVKYDEMKIANSERKLYNDRIWKELQTKVSADQTLVPFDEQKLREIQRTLVDGMMSANREARDAMNKVEQLQLADPLKQDDCDQEFIRGQPKRLSYYVRELRAQISSPPAASEVKSVEALNEKLYEYEEAMDRLLLKLEEKQRQIDDELLTDPQIMQCFKDVQKLIPLIKTKQIIAATDMPRPDQNKLACVLDKYRK